MVSNDGVVGDGMSPTTSSKVTPPKGKPPKQTKLKGGYEENCDINGKETINRKKDLCQSERPPGWQCEKQNSFAHGKRVDCFTLIIMLIMQSHKDLAVMDTAHRKNRRTTTALWAKTRRLAHKGMLMAFYLPILIVCGFVSKTSPIWVKVILFITIAYIIAPFDVVPNATPFVGYSDDIIARTTAIRALKKCITSEATTKARKWFVQKKRRSISVAKKTPKIDDRTLTSGVKA